MEGEQMDHINKPQPIIMTTELVKIKGEYYFKIHKAVSLIYEFNEKPIIEVNPKK